MAEITPLSQLLAAIQPIPSGWSARVGEDWRQGRTLYGGISAALCVEAALRRFPDLPPLRSAQFSFIGPATGDVSMDPTMLRAGKSTMFIAVDMMGDDGLAARAILCFGTKRASSLAFAALPMPAVPRPEACSPLFPEGRGPNFAQHFDVRMAAGERPFSAAPVPDYTLWQRHRDAAAPRGPVSLLALADAAPPAATIMAATLAPLSTITWTIDMLDDVPADDDGWRLTNSRADWVRDGYSSQSMNLWHSSGIVLMAATQYVAVFA